MLHSSFRWCCSSSSVLLRTMDSCSDWNSAVFECSQTGGSQIAMQRWVTFAQGERCILLTSRYRSWMVMVVPEWFMATGPPFSMDVDDCWRSVDRMAWNSGTGFYFCTGFSAISWLIAPFLFNPRQGSKFRAMAAMALWKSMGKPRWSTLIHMVESWWIFHLVL